MSDLRPSCHDWPKCACGRRFPTLKQLELHVRRDGCLGEREYRRLVTRRAA